MIICAIFKINQALVLIYYIDFSTKCIHNYLQKYISFFGEIKFQVIYYYIFFLIKMCCKINIKNCLKDNKIQVTFKFVLPIFYIRDSKTVVATQMWVLIMFLVGHVIFLKYIYIYFYIITYKILNYNQKKDINLSYGLLKLKHFPKWVNYEKFGNLCSILFSNIITR